MKPGSSEHLERVREALETHGKEARKRCSRRRGYLAQAQRREVEREARKRVVEHVRLRVIEGARKQETAASLGLPPRTVRHWESQERKEGLASRRRGRPPQRSTVEARNRALCLICLHGPLIGVEMLGRLCPGMARGEIRDLLWRYREHFRREHELCYESLAWKQPGRVWAMDHCEPPQAVEGRKAAILSVRDLSSGAQILWQEEPGPRAVDTTRDLERCFAAEGAPLVLKCDNGPAFIARELRDLCAKWEVELLWSPPYTPRYNGAAESGIRWLKERTEHAALLGGHPTEWKAEDLEWARVLTNQLPKDPRHDATARGEVFQSRTAISKDERAAFRDRLHRERRAERRSWGIGDEVVLERLEEAAITREAMSRALVALGILSITERRVAPTLKRLRAAKI